MLHLSEEELLDVAEGTRPDGALPHLAGCASCRRQVMDLRAMMSAAKDVDVPEPSPLFWEHLSARVRDGVAAAGAERDRPFGGVTGWLTWPHVLQTAAVAIAIAAAIGTLSSPGPRNPSGDQTSVVVEAVADDLVPLASDPSLSLIADLAGDLDWETAVEAGLTGGADGLDHLLRQLSDDERVELQRLLKQELSGVSAQGAS